MSGSTGRRLATKAALLLLLAVQQSYSALLGHTRGVVQGRVLRGSRTGPPVATVTVGPPRRNRGLPEMPPSGDTGFIFGEASLLHVLDAFRSGRPVLMAEDDDEDAEVSIMMSGSDVRPEHIDFVTQHARSLQVAMGPALYDAISGSLDQIVLDNFNLSRPILSVSARGGGRDPTSSADIAQALNAIAAAARDPAAQALSCPGAIPITRCREGGVLRRAGGSESVVELANVAGLPPMGLYATMRASGLRTLRDAAAQWDLPFTSTADLVAYKRQGAKIAERTSPPARMPTRHGRFTAHCYRSCIDGTEHIALVKCEAADAGSLQPFLATDIPPLVRVHSECCTGDVFGSLRCDCGPQLEKALEAIEADGCGVLLYLRGQEGRGIGLGAKIHAYTLQEQGIDTLDANKKLGLPVDSREYGTGAQILADLGIRDMRLMSNNPKKFSGLAGYGLRIVERVPSHVEPNPENIAYLRCKEERMGHLLDLNDKYGHLSLNRTLPSDLPMG